jgi:hypothetical protein
MDQVNLPATVGPKRNTCETDPKHTFHLGKLLMKIPEQDIRGFGFDGMARVCIGWMIGAAFALSVVCGAPETAAAASKDEILGAVFGAAEKRLIREALGGMPGTSTNPRAGTSDADEDEGDKVSKGKKAGRGKSESKSKSKGNKNKAAKGKGKSGQLPPGLAKRDELPPGLKRMEALPAGLAKRSLPRSLEEKLPTPPDGVERVIVDNDVVLIEKATNRVLDILTDVLLKQ